MTTSQTEINTNSTQITTTTAGIGSHASGNTVATNGGGGSTINIVTTTKATNNNSTQHNIGKSYSDNFSEFWLRQPIKK